MWNWLGITNEPKSEVATENLKEGEPVDGNSESDAPSVDPKSSTDANVNAEKVKEVAANFGNYLYNFASSATQKAAKLKDSVDEKLEKTIVGDFNRENEKFVQEKQTRRVGDAVPPWVGYHEEEVMKSQILALTSDERNFLRDPPSGVEFQFDLAQTMPVALAVLKEDPALEEMRFKLVPKRVKEERFWRNYFYRVSLIKQSTQLSTISNKEVKNSPRESSSDVTKKGTEKQETSTPVEESQEDNVLDDAVVGSPTTNEFASDAFDNDTHLSEEEKTQMSLGLKDKETKKTEERSSNDWEMDKDLQDELESFELVDTNGDNDVDDDGWQEEIDELLQEDAKEG